LILHSYFIVCPAKKNNSQTGIDHGRPDNHNRHHHRNGALHCSGGKLDDFIMSNGKGDKNRISNFRKYWNSPYWKDSEEKTISHEKFIAHLNYASEEVKTWPKWKQDILQGRVAERRLRTQPHCAIKKEEKKK